MDSDIEDEIIQKHNQAEAFISLFFLAVDIIGYLVVLGQFGFGCKRICSLVQRMFVIILFDGALRIVNLQLNTFVYSLQKEILTSAIASIQFFLILNIVNAVFEDKKNQNFSAGDMGIRNKPLLVCWFFFCSLVFIFSKIFSLVQYVGCLFAVCGFGYYVKKKTSLFLEGVAKKKQNFSSRYFIQNLLLFIGFYFFFHYAIKITSLFIDNPLYCSYIQMGYDVFKEIGKYITFTFVFMIYYVYSRYINVEEIEFQNESQVPVQNSGTF